MIDRERINTEVRALERLDLEGLRSAWSDRFGPAPRLRSSSISSLPFSSRKGGCRAW